MMLGDFVSTLEVVDVEEHDDGSATYRFQYDERTGDMLAGFGLELVIRCAAFGLDIQDALDSLEREIPTPTREWASVSPVASVRGSTRVLCMVRTMARSL